MSDYLIYAVINYCGFCVFVGYQLFVVATRAFLSGASHHFGGRICACSNHHTRVQQYTD